VIHFFTRGIYRELFVSRWNSVQCWNL